MGVPDKYTPENTNPQFSQSVSQSVVHKQHARLCRQEWGSRINTMRPRAHRGAPKRPRASPERPRGVPRKGQRSPREAPTQATCSIVSAGMGVPDKYNASYSNGTGLASLRGCCGTGLDSLHGCCGTRLASLHDLKLHTRQYKPSVQNTHPSFSQSAKGQFRLPPANMNFAM